MAHALQARGNDAPHFGHPGPICAFPKAAIPPRCGRQVIWTLPIDSHCWEALAFANGRRFINPPRSGTPGLGFARGQSRSHDASRIGAISQKHSVDMFRPVYVPKPASLNMSSAPAALPHRRKSKSSWLRLCTQLLALAEQ